MNLGILILFIAAGAVVSYAVTKFNNKLGAWITVVVSFVSLLYLLLTKNSPGGVSGFSLAEFEMTSYGWYFAMIMLVTYLAVSFFNPYWMEKLAHPAAYNLFYLLSLAGTIGVFFSKNFLALFICWEVVVWASLFIIPMGKSRRAAVVYYAVSIFGSMAMLYGIMLLYSKYDSFDLVYVLGRLSDEPALAVTVFFLIAAAGIAKLGVFPFHIWLPIAHANAPHTFSPVLSGGLVKMGGFAAFLAVAVMPSYKAFSSHVQVAGLPLENYTLLLLGAISIVIGTLMAIKQEDVKKLIAYSTVANSGYILIGIGLADQIGSAGGLMHVFSHAMAAAAAFITIAAVAYRAGTTKMSELGGLIHKMPVTYITYLIAIISLAGIPPMSGFISKWLIFQSLTGHGLILVAIAAFFGSIGSFLYVFRPLSAVFLGQLSPRHEKVKEAPFTMLVPMVLLSLLTLYYGIFPSGMLKLIGEIQSAVGINPIQIDGTGIIASNGRLDAPVVTAVFAFGFVLALVLFMLLPKAKKVGLMDTYTSSEFIYTPELYHYSHNFYAPFERLYKKHPSVENFFDALARKADELGQLVSTLFFSYRPAVTVLWISIVSIIIFLWGGKV